MNAPVSQQPVVPGEPAPDFVLPAADGNGMVALADYRGRSHVFLSLLIGLWCPFCRRAIAQMGAAEGMLKAAGVETVGVVATESANAQLYFRFRPSRLRLGSDPDLSTHRAYGLPKPEPTAQLMDAMASTRINPTGELPEALPIDQAASALARMDGYQETATDRADMERQWPQLKGQFLIDPEGIVRWANIECATQGLAGIGKFPTVDEVLAAVRAARS